MNHRLAVRCLAGPNSPDHSTTVTVPAPVIDSYELHIHPSIFEYQ